MELEYKQKSVNNKSFNYNNFDYFKLLNFIFKENELELNNVLAHHFDKTYYQENLEEILSKKNFSSVYDYLNKNNIFNIRKNESDFGEFCYFLFVKYRLYDVKTDSEIDFLVRNELNNIFAISYFNCFINMMESKLDLFYRKELREYYKNDNLRTNELEKNFSRIINCYYSYIEETYFNKNILNEDELLKIKNISDIEKFNRYIINISEMKSIQMIQIDGVKVRDSLVRIFRSFI